MPRINIHNGGAVGIVKDTDRPPYTLPPEAWSDGQNVRFVDNKVSKFLGHSAVFDPPTVAPYWALAVPTSTALYWVYAGLAKVYVHEGGVHTDLTRTSGGDYSAAASLIWNGGILNGVPILNNGVDVPQFWATIDPATKLANLTNWPAGVTCDVFRPFKAFGLALGVHKSSGTVHHPHMVKWSHPADPGAVPSSWDETDATKDAGETDLTDTDAGIIKDGLELGNLFIVYKEGSTWAMQFVGGSFIFRFFKLPWSSGILTKDCVVALPPKGAQKQGSAGHFVATGDDLIVHDGQSIRSLVDRRWRRWLAANIDTSNFGRSYCVVNFAQREAWFCFPEVGSTWPSLVLAWNLVDGSVGVRDIADMSFMAHGPISETDPTASWDGDADTWADDTTLWNDQLFTPFVRRLLSCDPTNTKLFQMDNTNQANAVNMSSYVERQGLAIIGRDRQNKPIVDFSKRKLVHRVWARGAGGPFTIKVGVQEKEDDAVTYSSGMTFDPSSDEYVDVDPPISGRLITVRFESSANVAWTISSYDLDIEVLGEF